jgi:phosphoribosylaminoimidazole-succinocarboxamide synthase
MTDEMQPSRSEQFSAYAQPPLPDPFLSVDLPLPSRRSGKVREIYPLSEGRLLLVTTDRLSAFDRVLGAAPFKGQVLNQLSAWWFEQTREILPNHLLDLPDPNAALAVEVEPFPVEVIVRGYITGVTSTALWQRYSLGERVIYGQRFPEGLRKNQALPHPVITPTTKGGPSGHDELPKWWTKVTSIARPGISSNKPRWKSMPWGSSAPRSPD